MRLSTFGLAAVLLFFTAIFSTTSLAQHSSGGGGGSTSSSSSVSSGGGGGGGGGGGFHGGSSGGSTSSGSSGGSHSSGGSGSHSSGASGSSAHGSTAHSSTSHPANSASPSIHGNAGTRPAAQAPQKKGFFASLLHPFRKPQPTTKTVAELRRPICFKGPCAAVCPTGHASAIAGCGGSVVSNAFHRTCSARQIWSGGSCLQQTRFLDDCNGNRVLMEQQWQRLQQAEAARQSMCSTGSAQECSDAAGESQTEGDLYRQLHDRYLQCRLRRSFPFASAFSFSGYSGGLSLDRLQAEYR
jgi:hypothetical protein